MGNEEQLSIFIETYKAGRGGVQEKISPFLHFVFIILTKTYRIKQSKNGEQLSIFNVNYKSNKGPFLQFVLIILTKHTAF